MGGHSKAVGQESADPDPGAGETDGLNRSGRHTSRTTANGVRDGSAVDGAFMAIIEDGRDAPRSLETLRSPRSAAAERDTPRDSSLFHDSSVAHRGLGIPGRGTRSGGPAGS